jgi:hypothetical protein
MLANDKVTQNHVGLYLVLGEDFKEAKEDHTYKKRWVVDTHVADRVHKALIDIHAGLSEHDLGF